MAIPRYISGKKYWFLNFWEHSKLLHTRASGVKPTIVRSLLLLTLALLRWAVRLAEIYLSIDELDTAICYSLRDSAFGLSMIRCTRSTPTMSTFGSRLMRKNPKLVGNESKSGSFVIQARYIEEPLKVGSVGKLSVDPWRKSNEQP